MSLINLSVDELEKTSSGIELVDKQLQVLLPKIATAINAIATDVQGTELNSLLKSIDDKFDNSQGKINKNLNKLEDFIKSQLKSYRLTEEEAEEALRKTFAKMRNIAGTSPIWMDDRGFSWPALLPHWNFNIFK